MAKGPFIDPKTGKPYPEGDWRRGTRSKPQSTAEKTKGIKKLRGNPGDPRKRGTGTVSSAETRAAIRRRAEKQAAFNKALLDSLGKRKGLGAGIGKAMLGGALAGTALATGINVVAANERARRQRALRGAEEVKRRRAAKAGAGFRTNFQRGGPVAQRAARPTRQQRAARTRPTRPTSVLTSEENTMLQGAVNQRQGLRARSVEADVIPERVRRMNELLDRVENLTAEEALPMARMPL